jgi:prevent-host-death family protein
MAGAVATFSRTELTRRTREILELVRRGQPAVIKSYGREQAVLVDPLDYRLLQGLAGVASARRGPVAELQDLLRRYLGSEISLAKMAAELGVSRFELMERFDRLGVPVNTGPADLREAQEEVEAARSQG